eukprot:SAG31_NODE_4541_length_3152_cov_1.717000_3_plen_164_part_00
MLVCSAKKPHRCKPLHHIGSDYALVLSVDFAIACVQRRLRRGDRSVDKRNGGRPTPLVPVVGLTGNADPAEIEKCRRAGMCQVLTKPIEMVALCVCFHAFCKLIVVALQKHTPSALLQKLFESIIWYTQVTSDLRCITTTGRSWKRRNQSYWQSELAVEWRPT